MRGPKNNTAKNSLGLALLRNFGFLPPSAGQRTFREDERVEALHKQTRLCRDVLELFKDGVLVLDEVDTILHPLRSELNWPLGGKVPLDFTTDKGATGMRWLLPFHALEPFFFATGGKCVIEVQLTQKAQKLLHQEKKVSLQKLMIC